MNQFDTDPVVPNQGVVQGEGSVVVEPSPVLAEPGLSDLSEGRAIPTWRTPPVPKPVLDANPHEEVRTCLAAGGEVPTQERVDEVVKEVVGDRSKTLDSAPAGIDESDDEFFNALVRQVYSECFTGERGPKRDFAALFRRQMQKSRAKSVIEPPSKSLSESRASTALDAINNIIDRIDREQSTYERGMLALSRVETFLASIYGILSEFGEDLKSIGDTTPVILEPLQEWVDDRRQAQRLGLEYIRMALRDRKEEAEREIAASKPPVVGDPPDGTF